MGGGGGGMRSPAPLAPWRYNSKIQGGRDKRELQRAGDPGLTSGRGGVVREGAGPELGPPLSVSGAPGDASVTSLRWQPPPPPPGVSPTLTPSRYGTSRPVTSGGRLKSSPRLKSRKGSIGGWILSAFFLLRVQN